MRSKGAKLIEDEAITKEFTEFPADVVVRPRNGASMSAKPGAVYLVNTNDKLNEALLLQMEAQRIGRVDFGVIALLEEPEMRTISRKKFPRAQNRSLTMPIFRGDEDAAMNVIARRLGLPVAIGHS